MSARHHCKALISLGAFSLRFFKLCFLVMLMHFCKIPLTQRNTAPQIRGGDSADVAGFSGNAGVLQDVEAELPGEPPPVAEVAQECGALLPALLLTGQAPPSSPQETLTTATCQPWRGLQGPGGLQKRPEET